MEKKTAAVLAAAGSLVLSLAAGGCSQISDQLSGARSASSDVVTTTPILVTRHWSVIDGMLSVVVENTTDRTLRYAQGVVTATDDRGAPLVTSDPEPTAGCCDVMELPPGQQYGFYLDVDPADADRIDEVDVAYRNVSWAGRTQSAEDQPSVTGKPTGLERTTDGAVVLADLRSASPVTEVVAQAFINDRDGDFVALVSGRWTCLQRGTRHIRMELFHPLPAGVEVDRVLVHRLVDDPTRATPDCPSSTPAP